MKKLLTPVKVGILALVSLAGFLYAIQTVQQGALGSGNTYQVYALLDDVLGLAKRSRVVMAGIEVGYIESIELVGNKARLNLRINQDVPLYRDAGLSKISESLLGDKLITLTTGRDAAHRLPDGGEIKNIYEEADASAVFSKLADITTDIREVTNSLKKVIGDMESEDALGGVMKRMNEIADNVATLTRQVNDTVLRGSDKIEQILSDVAGVTSGTRERYRDILDNVQAVSADVRRLVNNLNEIVGQGEEDWKESVGGVRETLEKASRSLENLDHITRKINEGQGTLGRLVNDDQILEKAENVLDDASTFTSKLARLRTEIDLRTEFNVRQAALKNYLALRLIPKTDKYYMIELIDDPRGAIDVVKTCTSSDEASCTETITVTEDFKWSVQFFKRYYWLGLRFGIIENTGGLGANVFLFNDDLEFKVDLFQFGQNEFGEYALPRLRALLVYRPTWLANHVYLAAGGDDFLNMNLDGNRRDTFDYFFGAGLHFDDDLKALFTAVGTPSF
jgi:phospholipid/cholesterol/gamma-HCH transport system substrate-binding protein